jgi:cysteinyl-tRNA synthetase
VTPADWTGSAAEHFALIKERDSSDAEWAKVAREKDEKWSLHLTSLGRASEALEVARKSRDRQQGDAEGVKKLVDGSADVLGPYLGETVNPPQLRTLPELIK